MLLELCCSLSQQWSEEASDSVNECASKCLLAPICDAVFPASRCPCCLSLSVVYNTLQCSLWDGSRTDQPSRLRVDLSQGKIRELDGAEGWEKEEEGGRELTVCVFVYVFVCVCGGRCYRKSDADDKAPQYVISGKVPHAGKCATNHTYDLLLHNLSFY